MIFNFRNIFDIFIVIQLIISNYLLNETVIINCVIALRANIDCWKVAGFNGTGKQNIK